MNAIENNFQNRNISMDILRIIACFMVITSHATADLFYIPWSPNMAVTTILGCISAGAVPLFFMMSGAFSTSTSITKSIRKIMYFFFLFVLFKCAYAIWDCILENRLSIETLYYEKRITDLTTYKYHLWYIPEYMLVLLAAPVINSAVKQNKKIPAYLSAIFFLYCFVLPNSMPVTISQKIKINPIEALLEVLPLNFVIGIGYYSVGKTIYNHIQNEKELLKEKKILPYICGISWVVFTIVMSYLVISRSANKGAFDDTLLLRDSLLVFFSNVSLFTLFALNSVYKRQNTKPHKIINMIALCTLYIYLIHPLFVELYRRIGINCLTFPVAISVPTLDSLVFIPSLFFAIIALAIHRSIKKTLFRNNHVSS